MYFYRVEPRDGSRLAIALWKEPFSGSVRITWDDGGIGAYVAPNIGETDILAEPQCLSADGLTEALIMVIPKDAHGVRMGPGFDVAIEPDSLDPGTAVSGVTAHLSGAYMQPVVATRTGTATVTAYSEGVRIPKNARINYVSSVPTAAFDCSQPARAGQPVTFSDLSSGGVPPYAYAWSFGDADQGTSTEPDPVFIYDAPGSYVVDLHVTDQNACVDVERHVVNVEP